MQELLLVTFTFGVAIFTFLSMLEAPVWKLIFTGSHADLADSTIRFVHRNLRYLTSKLPPSNGGVILVGTFLMILQGNELSWHGAAAALPVFYWVGLFVILVIFKNAKTVFSIRAHNSESEDIDLLITDLKRVGRDHHVGLLLNLIALITQLTITWS